MGVLEAMSEAPPVTETRGAADSSDAKLLDAARNGSRAAAEALVESTYKFVYASLFRLCGGDVELASDLTQETYRKAWTAAGSFEGRARLTTWLYRIAYKTFLNERRRSNACRPIEAGSLDDLTSPSPGPEQLMNQREASTLLKRTVLELPEPLRFVITAKFWGELRVRDIAAEEGITEVAVRKRLKRAFDAMRTALEGTKL